MEEDESQTDGQTNTDSVPDIEDSAGQSQTLPTGPRVNLKRKRDQAGIDSQSQGSDLSQNWRDALGPAPPMGKTKVKKLWLTLFLCSFFSICHHHHHHLPMLGVPTDMHKLLHSWRSWAEERRECKSIWVQSFYLYLLSKTITRN